MDERRRIVVRRVPADGVQNLQAKVRQIGLGEFLEQSITRATKHCFEDLVQMIRDMRTRHMGRQYSLEIPRMYFDEYNGRWTMVTALRRKEIFTEGVLLHGILILWMERDEGENYLSLLNRGLLISTGS